MTVKNIDNKLIPLAKRYSDALLAVAEQKGKLDAIYGDLKTVVDSLESVNELAVFLSHPAIPYSEKKDVIQSIFSNRIEQDTLVFLYLLLEKNKLNLVGTVLHCFEDSIDNAKNILNVGVVSAVEVDEDLRHRLQEKLESKLHKTIKFDFSVNPDILAGLILKIKDKTIDGSMASKLAWFKKLLR